MPQDVFGDELRRLLAGVNNPGPMYDGWQNPTNKPGDKAGNGVYSTPFDRQGGSEVAQRQLEEQARDIITRLCADKGYTKEAIDEMLQVLKGTTQSPADAGNNAPPLDPHDAFHYGAGFSAQQNQQSLQAQFSAQLASDPNWQKYQAFLAAETEKEEKEKAKKDLEKLEDDEKKEEKALSVLAQKLFPAIQSAVSSMIDQAMSAYGFKQNAAQSAPQAQATNQGTTQAPAGLSAQGNNTGVNWNSLAGVQMPPGMQVPANNAAYSAGENPQQSVASKFMNEAMTAMSAVNDTYVRGQIQEELKTVYAGILSGQPVSIQHPILRKVAEQSGVNYVNFGIGGVR